MPEAKSNNFLEIMSCILQNQAETHHLGHYGVLFHWMEQNKIRA